MKDSNKWLQRYRLCLGYAKTFNNEFKFDIVHDAWITYYRNNETDLFEADLKYNAFLYRAIKWSYYRWLENESKYTSVVEPIPDAFVHPGDIIDGQIIKRQLKNKILSMINRVTDKRRKKKRHTNRPLLEVLDYRIQGFDTKEIAKYLDITDTSVNNYLKIIKEMNRTNPFHGSTIEVNKTITESQWNKRIDHDDFETEDENEYYRLLKHKISKEGWLVRLNTPKTNPYLK